MRDARCVQIGAVRGSRGRVPALAAAIALLTASPAPARSWLRHTIDNSFLGADGARAEIGAFDHAPEFAVVWEQTGVTTLHKWPLDPAIAACAWPSRIVGATPNSEDAVAVDLDGDGDRDVVVCMEGPQRRVAAFINRGDGFDEFNFNLAPFKWMIAEPADLDGDGRPDVVVGGRFVQQDEQGQIAWLRPGAHASQFEDWTSEVISEVGWPMTILTLDVDGDGDQDVVLADRYGPERGLRWLENPHPAHGAGLWTSRTIGLANRRVKSAAAADINGDGRIDFVATYERVGNVPPGLVVLFGTAQGWSMTHVPLPQGMGEPKNVAVADIDLDGRPDIALTCESAYKGLAGVCVFLQRDGGAWLPIDVSGPEGCKFDVVTTIDVDGDGDLDLITTEEGDNGEYEALGVVWYENPTIHSPSGMASFLTMAPEACEAIPSPFLVELARRLREAALTPPARR
ncbi:MAG: VCBS repeat-containing protein [Phycisphaerales bacterium]|nr:VCBS repeat-containing protein [Phycisphaerales bacterium]